MKSDSGGAGRAAYRLHQGLRDCGVTSIVAVDTKVGKDPYVHKTSGRLNELIGKSVGRIWALPLQLYRKRAPVPWSISAAPRRTLQRVLKKTPDIVNLHWLGEGFLPLASLQHAQCPIVWTIHDMWAFTGGCHYDDGCERYRERCGQCPQLGSARSFDLSRWNWSYKDKALRNVPICFVAPSEWLAKCAANSSLIGQHRIEVIPYGLDLHTFRCSDKKQARFELGLPLDKTLLLFVAFNSTGNARKGFDLFRRAIAELESMAPDGDFFIVILGSSEVYDSLELALPGTCQPTVSDDRKLALVYSAADAFVAPSRQDNLPNTVLESLACGTPCIAFRIGGMPDMIDSGKTGYLAEPFDPVDLARGMIAVTRDSVRTSMSEAARETAERQYALRRQANRYLDLYRELIDGRN